MTGMFSQGESSSSGAQRQFYQGESYAIDANMQFYQGDNSYGSSSNA